MTAKKFAPQVDLLAEGAGIGINHLEEMEKDLLQTVVVLKEAIAKLNSSFFQLHAAVREQQEMMRLLAAESGLSAEGKEKMAELEKKIAGQINDAVMGLQFEDMTSQLIGRASNRAEGLRAMLLLVGSAVSAMAQMHGSKEVLDVLENTCKTLAVQSEELNRRLACSVLQRHMESGSVELF